MCGKRSLPHTKPKGLVELDEGVPWEDWVETKKGSMAPTGAALLVRINWEAGVDFLVFLVWWWCSESSLRVGVSRFRLEEEEEELA